MEISDKDRIREYFSNSSDNDEDFVAAKYLNEGNEVGLKEIAREHWEKSPSTEVELQHILDRIHFHINTTVNKRSVLIRIMSALLSCCGRIVDPPFNCRNLPDGGKFKYI